MLLYHSKMSDDVMLEFFFFFLMLCEFAACMFVRLKKKTGGKLGNFNVTIANTAVIIGYDPSFGLCKPDVSSLPNIHDCDFLEFLQCIVACVMY